MSYSRRAYDDADSTAVMALDCAAASAQMRLPRREDRAARLRAAVQRPAPSLAYEDFPSEVAKRDLAVSEAAARLASALHLHLD